jgi:two-component system, NarL family, invasion response regulator UvrY
MTVRVVVADDQAPFRRAARSVLSADSEFELVGEVSSGEAAVAAARALAPDLVLLDIKMAGIGGIEAAREIAIAVPRTATILVSTYREEDLPAGASTCGAAGYLHKSELRVEALRELLTTRSRTGTR